MLFFFGYLIIFLSFWAFLSIPNVTESSAPCKLELEDTIKKKKDEYEISTLKRRNIERGLMERNYPNSNWKPKGNLIANLHEHKVNYSSSFEGIRYFQYFTGWYQQIGSNCRKTFICQRFFRRISQGKNCLILVHSFIHIFKFSHFSFGIVTSLKVSVTSINLWKSTTIIQVHRSTVWPRQLTVNY